MLKVCARLQICALALQFDFYALLSATVHLSWRTDQLGFEKTA